MMAGTSETETGTGAGTAAVVMTLEPVHMAAEARAMHLTSWTWVTRVRADW